MAFEWADEPGVTAPQGYWDPLGLAKNLDQEGFDKYRTAELKHGRVAQVTFILLSMLSQN